MIATDEDIAVAEARPSKPRGGRPTKAAAAERDERLLDIATRMFMDQGFDATSMEGLAEAASVGKATLYARYADKGALFIAVLQRRILQVYEPIEDEFRHPRAGETLDAALRRIGRRLLEKSISCEAITLVRIIAAQAPRFPDLAELAAQGAERQLRLVETVLRHFAREHAYVSDDFPMLADLFLSIVLGRATTRHALFGVPLTPDILERRVEAAVALFVRGLVVAPKS